MSSPVLCLQSYRAQSNTALLIEAGVIAEMSPRLPRDAAISSEMSRKSCCHEVAKETQSEEGKWIEVRARSDF